MKVIQANCRVQFTAADIDFILETLGRKAGDPSCIVKLLADTESRDLILDNEVLFRTLLERGGCLRVSTHFYFYILVRHVLKRAGINDREVADYVAELLAEYSRTERANCVIRGEPQSLNYFFEMLAALQTADERGSFLIRACIGNHSLFFSGVFAERIRFRSEKRGFPDVSYFERLGISSFRMARDHRLAHRYDLAPIFDTLAEQFQTARRALNDLSERLLAWEECRYSPDLFSSGKSGRTLSEN